MNKRKRFHPPIRKQIYSENLAKEDDTYLYSKLIVHPFSSNLNSLKLDGRYDVYTFVTKESLNFGCFDIVLCDFKAPIKLNDYVFSVKQSNCGDNFNINGYKNYELEKNTSQYLSKNLFSQPTKQLNINYKQSAPDYYQVTLQSNEYQVSPKKCEVTLQDNDGLTQNNDDKMTSQKFKITLHYNNRQTTPEKFQDTSQNNDDQTTLQKFQEQTTPQKFLHLTQCNYDKITPQKFRVISQYKKDQKTAQKFLLSSQDKGDKITPQKFQLLSQHNHDQTTHQKFLHSLQDDDFNITPRKFQIKSQHNQAQTTSQKFLRLSQDKGDKITPQKLYILSQRDQDQIVPHCDNIEETKPKTFIPINEEKEMIGLASATMLSQQQIVEIKTNDVSSFDYNVTDAFEVHQNLSLSPNSINKQMIDSNKALNNSQLILNYLNELNAFYDYYCLTNDTKKSILNDYEPVKSFFGGDNKPESGLSNSFEKEAISKKVSKWDLFVNEYDSVDTLGVHHLF